MDLAGRRSACLIVCLAVAASTPAAAQRARTAKRTAATPPSPIPVKHYCAVESDRIAFQLSYVLRGLDRDGKPMSSRELVGVRCRRSPQWVTGIDSGGVSNKVEGWDCRGAQMGLRDLDQDHAIGTFGGVAPMQEVAIGTRSELNKTWAVYLHSLNNRSTDTWDAATTPQAVAMLRDFQKRLRDFASLDKAPQTSALVRWGASAYLLDAQSGRVQILSTSFRVLARAEARCDGIATD